MTLFNPSTGPGGRDSDIVSVYWARSKDCLCQDISTDALTQFSQIYFVKFPISFSFNISNKGKEREREGENRVRMHKWKNHHKLAGLIELGQMI